ncbi:MAG: MlaE family lipid ABC transporter permease subunit [Alphaproteobacteria bacterium]|nr:MlaE family lipid ABC transporter permease subunit [Alphaproteobacteria bacterium]
MEPADLVEETRGETRVLRLSGRLTMARVGAVDRALREIQPDGRDLVVDLSAVERIDTAGAWLVYRLIRNWTKAGVHATVENASADALALIGKVGEHDVPMRIRPDRGHPLVRRLAEIGDFVIRTADTFGNFLGFLGNTLVALARLLLNPRRLRWHAISRQMEVVGINAIGIVGLMSFLVGIVIAQQGAVQLRQFGAEVFTINLVGRSVLRELGVLMTAIMVAGRSGSAFAAQIGSMKLAEEVDALRTIGVSPTEALTIPRLIATAIMMPLLSFYAAILGIIGGALFSWVSLGIPIITFIQRTQEVVPLTDLWITLIKAPVFGIIIAVTGCYHGMQVTGNAESVGFRTTAAVVQSIFLVIVLDAFFAVFFSALGWI